MTKTTIYGLNNAMNKEEAKEIIAKANTNIDNVKAVCDYSNKGNLKGFEIYKSGSKSLVAYIDLLSNRITYYSRRKVMNVASL